MTVYNPGMLVQARRRLWRVDSQQDSVLYLTAVDETTLQTRLYLPLEPVQPGSLPAPNPNIVGSPQALELMLRSFRLSMMHSTARPRCFHCSARGRFRCRTSSSRW